MKAYKYWDACNYPVEKSWYSSIGNSCLHCKATQQVRQKESYNIDKVFQRWRENVANSLDSEAKSVSCGYA